MLNEFPNHKGKEGKVSIFRSLPPCSCRRELSFHIGRRSDIPGYIYPACAPMSPLPPLSPRRGSTILYIPLSYSPILQPREGGARGTHDASRHEISCPPQKEERKGKISIVPFREILSRARGVKDGRTANDGILGFFLLLLPRHHYPLAWNFPHKPGKRDSARYISALCESSSIPFPDLPPCPPSLPLSAIPQSFSVFFSSPPNNGHSQKSLFVLVFLFRQSRYGIVAAAAVVSGYYRKGKGKEGKKETSAEG